MANDEKRITRLSTEDVGRVAVAIIKNDVREWFSRKIGDLSQKSGIPKEQIGFLAYTVMKELVEETEKKLIA